MRKNLIEVVGVLTQVLGNLSLNSRTLSKVRALTWADISGTKWKRVHDDELGTGLKPLVVLPDGRIQLRVSSEGTPLVLSSDYRRVRALDSVNEELEV
jgi:hypothetical protein